MRAAFSPAWCWLRDLTADLAAWWREGLGVRRAHSGPAAALDCEAILRRAAELERLALAVADSPSAPGMVRAEAARLGLWARVQARPMVELAALAREGRL